MKARTARPRTRAAQAADDESCGLAAEDYAVPELDIDPSIVDDIEPAANGGEPIAPMQADDAVRVEVRPGEIVITIRTAALAATFDGEEAAVQVTPAPRRGRRAAPRGDDSGYVGLTQVPADKYKDGYSKVWIRSDLKDEYLSALQKVRALGGILTSSGGIRDLGAAVTPGRSRTSFHYTGRAIDLYIYTGMTGSKDRYLIQRDGGTDTYPEWRVLCVSENPLTTDPHYDASLLRTEDVEYLVWKKGQAPVRQRRTVTYFSLTDVLRQFGWERIPARSDWKTNYLSTEWWHFQHHKNLTSGLSRLGEELRRAWPSAKVASSGLALNAVFAGRSFRA